MSGAAPQVGAVFAVLSPTTALAEKHAALAPVVLAQTFLARVRALSRKAAGRAVIVGLAAAIAPHLDEAEATACLRRAEAGERGHDWQASFEAISFAVVELRRALYNERVRHVKLALGKMPLQVTQEYRNLNAEIHGWVDAVIEAEFAALLEVAA